MSWVAFEDYETLLQRRHDAIAGARRARMRLSWLHRHGACTTAVTERIRAGLRERARRLERERAAIERRMEAR